MSEETTKNAGFEEESSFKAKYTSDRNMKTVEGDGYRKQVHGVACLGVESFSVTKDEGISSDYAKASVTTLQNTYPVSTSVDLFYILQKSYVTKCIS